MGAEVLAAHEHSSRAACEQVSQERVAPRAKLTGVHAHSEPPDALFDRSTSAHGAPAAPQHRPMTLTGRIVADATYSMMAPQEPLLCTSSGTGQRALPRPTRGSESHLAPRS